MDEAKTYGGGIPKSVMDRGSNIAYSENVHPDKINYTAGPGGLIQMIQAMQLNMEYLHIETLFAKIRWKR